ncbi:T9SS type A sorting domain-containing protein [bacterium AH-315-C07]|nr:T9SS type A sorting domain-containing protein [bacterium AH-315-C07]
MPIFLKLVSFLVFISYWFNCQATHNRAGQITYTQLSTYEYEFTVVTYTYTYTGTQTDRPLLHINWGDNTSDSLERVSYKYLGSEIQENIYVRKHIYNGYGSFRISVLDPNRNGNIVNIPNSVDIPFYIDCLLINDPFLGQQNSTQFWAPPIMVAQTGLVFRHNVTAYDPDGDSLSYKLVPCKGDSGKDIPGYGYPEATDTLIINRTTGEMVWNSPGAIGDYAFTVKIKEYRDGYLIGFVLRDFQIEVVDSFHTAYSFDASIQSDNETGNYVYQGVPDSSIMFNVSYVDSNDQNISLVSYSELYNSGPNVAIPAILRDSIIPNGVISKFSWLPNWMSNRVKPYIVVFRATSINVNIANDLTILIWVYDPATLGYPKTDPMITDGSVLIYPNPLTSDGTLSMSNDNNAVEQIWFYNESGQLVHSANVPAENSIKLKRDHFQKGLIIYKLKSTSGNLHSGKFIVH